MKTKKFLMTTLLVMGMVIAKAANGFPPELVLVSQPVLTYNANSVTVYYDVQNIGDYTYRGNIYVYLDPDDGYYYAKKWVRVCPGSIRRVAISIPAYRPNPSWSYTVMPYYELGNELFSFTTFEYFAPVTFHWYGYRNEPWVVIHVGPRPRYYHRPCPYRYYYDGYYPILPPPPGGYPPGYFDHMHPLNPAHHTYGYHHSHGGYPANHFPSNDVPGYNHYEEHWNNAPQAVVRPNSNTSGSMSSGGNNSGSNNSNAAVRPSNNGTGSNTGSMSGRTDNNGSGRTGNSSGSVSGRTDSSSSRPSGNSSSGSRVSGSDSSRPSSSSGSGRTGNSSGSVSGRTDSSSSRPSGNSSSGSRVSGSDSGRSSGNSSSRSSGNSSGSSRSSSSRSGNSSNGSGSRSGGTSRSR